MYLNSYTKPAAISELVIRRWGKVMLIVGLTGGIATGKSTVSQRLREHYGFPVVDADVIAREVVAPGKPAYTAIVDYFGGITPHLLSDDGSGELNRPALGRTIFGNEQHRQKLNSIVHPAVRKAMAWETAKYWLRGHSVAIVDVPLLFESKLDAYVGLSVAVLCPEDAQYQRLRERNPQLSEQDARERIKSQVPLDVKRERADVVVENSQGLPELYDEVDSAVSMYMRPPTWRTVLQWIAPVGLVWALVAYYFRKQDIKKER